MYAIVDEIKQARQDLLTEEQKTKILNHVKTSLVTQHKAFIGGAPHFGEWKLDGCRCDFEAPYKFHPAITTYLRGLGFIVCRHYNKGGVEQGMSIWI